MASQAQRHEMPVQDAKIRVTNFKEVALGYDEDTAVAEAKRCLHCAKPHCVEGCPVHINIPHFIAALAEGNLSEAAERLKKRYQLAGSLRTCLPTGKPMRRPLRIGC